MPKTKKQFHEVQTQFANFLVRQMSRINPMASHKLLITDGVLRLINANYLKSDEPFLIKLSSEDLLNGLTPTQWSHITMTLLNMEPYPKF